MFRKPVNRQMCIRVLRCQFVVKGGSSASNTKLKELGELVDSQKWFICFLVAGKKNIIYPGMLDFIIM